MLSISLICSNFSLFQNPPWIFINNINNNRSSTAIDDENNLTADATAIVEVSGRDDTLLKILARKMNFNFEYVDVTSLVEMENYENVSQVSALGLEMLKRRVKKLIL